MSSSAKRTNPELWERVKARLMKGDKGGERGQWSARKAQLAVQEYKKAGGGYEGPKRADNHLAEWTHQDWGTKSGRTSRETGERYLPKRARQKLSDEEYQRTSRKKRADKAKGRQFSPQSADIAEKTRPTRQENPKPPRKTATRKAAPARKPAPRSSTRSRA